MSGLMISRLCKTYADKLVVDHISLSALRGEITGFLGPNGAGKTTTIRMIMGITAPDSGSIDFEDSDSAKIPHHLIGYLPEERGLYKDSKVINMLRFLSGLKGMDSRDVTPKAMNWLDKFGIADKAHSKIEELSKGMAQKVQFIATILHEPKYIILDEPFTGLDPVSQDLFKAELRRFADAGATILLSSHQMNILEELCDKIFLIHKGKELFHGSLSDLQDAYGNVVIKLHLEDAVDIPRIAELKGIQNIKQTGAGKLELDLVESANAQSILREIPSDIVLKELSLARSGLHEIFVKIAKEGRDEV